MIVVKLVGGLGNQMFQYAVGRSLSLMHDVPLKLDISTFEDYNDRAYSLKDLNVNGEIATAPESARFTKTGFLKGSFEKLKPYYRRSIIVERCFDFDANILNAPGDVYLDGYWQSENYFKDISELIRKEFKFKKEASGRNKDLIAEMADIESVSLHVRRGDYVSNNKVHEIHGTCSMEYYNNCMNLIKSRIHNPKFFIFSDDMSWVRQNMKIDSSFCFIDHNGQDKDYEDLHLMSSCKHNIIANSSFSWWGAWLNDNAQKVVYAPEKWANYSALNTEHRLPLDWIRVKV